jgi:hypothetical protein
MTSDSLAEPVESKVTRLLAIGLAPSAVIEEMAKVIDRPFAMEDFREALAAVAALVKETSLLPHFKDGFQGRPLYAPLGGRSAVGAAGQYSTDELRTLAGNLLVSYLSSENEALWEPDSRDAPTCRAAMQYAEAVVDHQESVQELNRAERDASSLHSQLEPRDRARLEQLVLWWRGRGAARRLLRLDDLVGEWERRTTSLKARSAAIQHETYIQALMTRDQLECAMVALEPSGRSLVEAYVKNSDERLVRATRPAAASLEAPRPWRPQGWWWYRAP